MDEQPPDDLVRPSKAAQILKVHIATVYRLIGRGIFRAWRGPSRRLLVSEAEVRAQLVPVVPRQPPDPLGIGTSERARAAQQARTEDVLRQAGFRL